MKKLIYFFSILLTIGVFSNIYADQSTVLQDTVFLKLWINCQGIGTTDIRVDTVLEGQVYNIKQTTITDARFLKAQPIVDAVAGSKFIIEEGALTENITIDWFFWNIDCSNGVFINFSGKNLFFNGYFLVNSDTAQFNFANGKVARLTIPKSQKFDSLLTQNGINSDSQLVFMFQKGSTVGDTLGIRSIDTDSTIVFETTHFSQILGGDRSLFSVLQDVESNYSTIPNEFILKQNYPNPFNPSTVIEFGLPSRSSVELKVYNILGKEVATLVNETKEAGMHKVSFDASKFTSGVYLYKLKTDKHSEFKKMIYIK